MQQCTDASDKKLAPVLDLILTSRCSVIAHCLVAAKNNKKQWIDSKREFKISQDKCVTVGLEQGYKSKQGCPPPSQIINSPQSHPSLTHHTLPDQQWCCHFSRGFAAYATSLATYIYWILSKTYRLQWEIAAVKSERHVAQCGRPENPVWQVNRQRHRASSRTIRSSYLIVSLRKSLVFKKNKKNKLEPRVSAVNISRNANGFHLLSKKWHFFVTIHVYIAHCRNPRVQYVLVPQTASQDMMFCPRTNILFASTTRCT